MRASLRRPAFFLPVVLSLATPLPSVARAHEAPSGWQYDAWCCGGQDCQPIASENVDVTAEGYLVSIPAGGHPMAHSNHRKLFAFSEVQESGDQQYHACILPNSEEFRCLYVPRMGY